MNCLFTVDWGLLLCVVCLRRFLVDCILAWGFTCSFLPIVPVHDFYSLFMVVRSTGRVRGFLVGRTSGWTVVGGFQQHTLW